MDLAGRPLTLETGKIAELANAAVMVTYGETTVLVTATASARPRDGIDFFPLSRSRIPKRTTRSALPVRQDYLRIPSLAIRAR